MMIPSNFSLPYDDHNFPLTLSCMPYSPPYYYPLYQTAFGEGRIETPPIMNFLEPPCSGPLSRTASQNASHNLSFKSLFPHSPFDVHAYFENSVPCIVEQNFNSTSTYAPIFTIIALSRSSLKVDDASIYSLRLEDRYCLRQWHIDDRVQIIALKTDSLFSYQILNMDSAQIAFANKIQ